MLTENERERRVLPDENFNTEERRKNERERERERGVDVGNHSVHSKVAVLRHYFT